MVHIYILFQKGAKRNNRNISYERRKVYVCEGEGCSEIFFERTCGMRVKIIK